MWTALVLAALLKAAASASASAATAARHFPSAQLPALSPSMTNKSNIFSNCLIGEMSPHLSPLPPSMSPRFIIISQVCLFVSHFRRK